MSRQILAAEPLQFARDFLVMLPSQLRAWGPVKGWEMAWKWSLYGREERKR